MDFSSHDVLLFSVYCHFIVHFSSLFNYLMLSFYSSVSFSFSPCLYVLPHALVVAFYYSLSNFSAISFSAKTNWVFFFHIHRVNKELHLRPLKFVHIVSSSSSSRISRNQSTFIRPQTHSRSVLNNFLFSHVLDYLYLSIQFDTWPLFVLLFWRIRDGFFCCRLQPFRYATQNTFLCDFGRVEESKR